MMRNLRVALLVAGLLSSFGAAAHDGPGKPEAVTLSGTLRTGVMAIGGETTGVTLTTKDGATWELQLKKGHGAKAEKWDGQRVVVRGYAREREGVEIPVRRIVEVRSIKPLRHS